MGNPDRKDGGGPNVSNGDPGTSDKVAVITPEQPIRPTESLPGRTGRRIGALRTFGGGGTTRVDVAALTGAFPATGTFDMETLDGGTDNFDAILESDSGEGRPPERANLSTPIPTAWPSMDPNSIEVEFEDEGYEAISPTRSQLPATFLNTAIASGVPMEELLMQINPFDIGVVYDVAGNTRAMRKLKDRPEIIDEHLKPIHKIITETVLKFGGDIFLYEGDAQLAIFPDGNEPGEANASYYIGQRTKRHFEAIYKAIQEEDAKNLKLEHIDPEEQVIGLRCVKFSPKGLLMHAERGPGAVVSGDEALARRSKAEKMAKAKEFEIPARERIGAYYYEVHGTDAAHINRLIYQYPPPSYTGRPTKIRHLPASIPPDPDGINQDIKSAIDPRSAEERVALMPTLRNIGVAVYIELLGIENPSQLRYIREIIARHYAQYGASIDKAIGNTLLVSFGAGFNTDQKDMLERATRASVETKMWLKTEIEPQLYVTAAVGISNLDLTTRVTVGTTERNDSTNLGDTHNTGARIQAEAATRARASHQTVIMVGEAAAGLTSFCEAEESTIHGIRGIGSMKMSEISDVKPPQKTKLHTSEDFVPPLVAGQEVPYGEFAEQVAARPITIISSASTVIQDLFCQRLLKPLEDEKGEEVEKSTSQDLLCTLKVESADQYIDYKSLHDLLTELEESQRFADLANVNLGALIDLIEKVAQTTGAEREEGHLAITREFIQILRTIDDNLAGIFYLCILEADVMDARSREVFEDAFQINSPNLKLIIGGHDLTNSNVETNMDDLTVAGAKEIVTFVLRTRTGADKDTKIVDDEALLKLVRPLIEPREVKGVLDNDGKPLEDSLDIDGNPLKVYVGAVNLASINVYLSSLISKAAIVQKKGKWIIAEGATLQYSKAAMFTETIGPLTRRFGERKRKRLENLALCFGMVNEFLSFKDIPAGVVRDEDEFDEFTLLLAQKGVLKKAPQVGEEAPFRLFQNKSFELEPKLRSAAEECNASDLKSKANLHFSIASKYGTDPFDINELELEDETTKERAEKTEEVKTKRSHFLDHAKKHFGYSEINEANVELLLHYLQMLRREAEEDFDISAARVLDKLLTEHHFESLTDKVLTANLSDEDANDTLTEAKIALMELLSILNTSGYRANSMNKTKWMTTDGESKILAWETHINTDEEGSANIDTIITLMQMRRIQGQVKDTTRDLVHARSAKEAGEAAQGGIIEQIKSLTNLADQLMKDRVLTKVSAINSVRTTARMADIMHIYAEIHVLYAKALKRVEGHYTLDDDEISAEDHLKIAREYCDKCRELANKANPIIEAEKPFETMEAARAGVLPTLLPEEEGLVQPAKTVVQSLKDLAEHVDGVAAIAATNLEFFDMLPWITGQILSEEEGGGILESSVPSQLAAILQFVKVILTTNPGLTKSDYSFDKNCDVTNLEEDTNFENLISRAKELAKIKQRSLDERGKRIYPNKILFPLIQLTESFKVLGRSIFAPHWDNPTTSEGKTSKQKYLNLLSKARTLGISSSETNGWPESETDNGTAAFAEFIARFNTTEADIDRAAISTPEEMSEVQTLFEESMERMLELRAFCDKKDGSPVLCAGMIPLDHELGKLCYEAKLAGLNIVKYEQFDTAS